MKYRFLRYPDGKAKAVTLSYDDGMPQDIRMAEVLGKYGMKCTFNLNSGIIVERILEGYMTPEEVKCHLLDAGHEIAIHGRLHQAPGLSRPIEVVQEMLKCREMLEKTFGRIIRGMAYPDTGITDFQHDQNYGTIRQILQELDIVYARTVMGGNDKFKLPTDWYAWAPTTHHNDYYVLDDAKQFVELDVDTTRGTYRWPRLFNMAGHSYEFDRDNNWERLEELCQILGNREDIWYATNMEIWEYVNAYNSLVFSADSSMVYNPTLYKIWFEVDEKVYSVEPGQTITVS